MPGTETSLLRFSTAGSVDDGKSTLIGRLLYDSKGVYEDQLASVAKASANSSGGVIDLALLTDGLRAEREQGITIDVAYRYFSTPRRKFIIADTPGHEQYTRNMATGASTADLAIILIDARNGILPQSRRHAFIANLLGTRHLVVAVNKMDLVDFDQSVFETIRSEFSAFLKKAGAPEALFIPISARDGDNVVSLSSKSSWYTGPSLLDYLETVPAGAESEYLPARFPVQYVLRPDLDFRGYAGQMASGVLRQGESVIALPSRRRSTISRIVTFDGDLAEVRAPQSVTLCLSDEIDISRGDMIVPERQLPHVTRRFRAHVVWMSSKPLEAGQTMLVKHTSHQVRALVRKIEHRLDIVQLDKQQTGRLDLNEIGEITLDAHRPLFFDEYSKNRWTGGFILIDPLTNETAGAGMIIAAEGREETRGPVTAAERVSRFGHRGAVVCVEDMDAAVFLERELFNLGCNVAVAGRLPSNAATVLYSAGMLAIAVGPVMPNAIDARGLAVAEVLELLEIRGVLTGSRPRLIEGDGI